ncbi:hypothetical protein F4780DRAFT_741382 [Xylariomycetidae sp. FL0641]|nr:hypothetical protein F4780DRAFT_741382 [Xylariomycetidae sp. FL0641]
MAKPVSAARHGSSDHSYVFADNPPNYHPTANYPPNTNWPPHANYPPNGSPNKSRAKPTHAAETHDDEPPAVAVTLTQPRVAVALGIPQRWYFTLFATRLLAIVPSLIWGLRLALRFTIDEILRDTHGQKTSDRDVALLVTKTSLALIWATASAYLAFFFTDCLMSRWLINYTAQATVIRLFTINCVYAYLTSWVVHLAGGTQDAGLLLPAWICISTILTACYHYTQRKIRIRKETFASMSVFSFASYCSMIALLALLHSTKKDAPPVPIVTLAKKACSILGHVLVDIIGVNREAVGI